MSRHTRAHVTIAGCALFVGLWGDGTAIRAQETVPLNARLAWDIGAANETQALENRYTLYVDGHGVPLSGVTCSTATGPASFVCSVQLPTLAPGAHVLQVSASQRIGDVIRESARSEPFNVFVPSLPNLVQGQRAAMTAPPVIGSSSIVTDDDAAFDIIATGLRMPVDLAAVADRVLLVAERGGVIRLFSNGQLRDEPVLSLPEVVGSTSAALLSIGADPKFATNGLLYIVSAVQNAQAVLTYRLDRVRFEGGRFSQRVVLLEDVPADAKRLAAIVRVAADGMVHVAFGDTADQRRDIPSSYNGKVLRLTPDGTTPREHRAASPIIASGFAAPLGLVWDPGAETLWVLDGGEAPRLHAIGRLAERRASETPPASVTLGQSLAARFARLPTSTRVISGSSGEVYVATHDALFRLRPSQSLIPDP